MLANGVKKNLTLLVKKDSFPKVFLDFSSFHLWFEMPPLSHKKFLYEHKSVPGLSALIAKVFCLVLFCF